MIARSSANFDVGILIKRIAGDGEDIQISAVFQEPTLSNLAPIAYNTYAQFQFLKYYRTTTIELIIIQLSKLSFSNGLL